MNYRILTLVSLLVSTPAFCQEGPSLCTRAEKPVFSCSTGKKIISVCQVRDGLQYRFGPAAKPELVWPDNISRTDLIRQGSLLFASGGGTYLRFTHGQTDYVVYSASGRGWEAQGVAVERQGKLIANIKCKQLPSPDFDIDLLQALKKDDKDFDIPGN
jgi:hypothetical protein